MCKWTDYERKRQSITNLSVEVCKSHQEIKLLKLSFNGNLY